MNECEHWECRLARVAEMAMVMVAEVIQRRTPHLSLDILGRAADILHADRFPCRCTHVPRPDLSGRNHAELA